MLRNATTCVARTLLCGGLLLLAPAALPGYASAAGEICAADQLKAAALLCRDSFKCVSRNANRPSTEDPKIAVLTKSTRIMGAYFSPIFSLERWT
jgi:hypothetical protein